MRKSVLVALCALAAMPAQAFAAITIQTSQAGFAAATTGVAVDSYDDTDYLGYNDSLARTAGSYSYTATAPNGLFGAGSPGDVWLSANSALDTLTFDLSSAAASAIGGYFFGSDINGSYAAGAVTVTVTDADGTVTYTLTNPSPGGFLGFTSDKQISQLTITAAQGPSDLYATVNDLTIGQAVQATSAVPEPATWAMMLGGFFLIGGTMRNARGRRVLAG